MKHSTVVIALLLAILASNSPWMVAATPLQQETATPTPCPPGSEPAIEGFVFEDLDRDQDLQPGEPPLTGVIVRLQTPEGVELQTRSTDSEGRFFYGPEAGIARGSYRLIQTTQEGFEITGGQERLVTVTACSIVTVLFPNIRQEPAVGPTLTPTGTVSPTEMVPAIATGSVTSTPSATLTRTGTITITATTTLRALTPIVTVITTTPGVVSTMVPVTPVVPNERLPQTGFDHEGDNPLLWPVSFVLLLVGAGLARRFFRY